MLAFTLTGPAVDLEFRSPDEHENLRNYEKFGVHRQALEASFGQILSWEPLKTRKACRIRCSRPGGGQVIDEDGREELIEWFVTTSLRFRSCTQTIRADIQHPT